MIPANLTINADDFGLDERVSRAILLCLEEGLINSFSVFPFADSFHDRLLKDIVGRFPDVKIGVHMSMVGPSEICPLDNDPKEFSEHKGHFLDFLARYMTGRYSVERVRQEWKSQIEFVGHYVGGAGNLAHLDSHQHLHVLPGLWPVAKALQREFGIPRLRVPYESLLRAVAYRFPFGIGLQALAWLRRERNSPAFIGFFSSTRFTLSANLCRLSRIQRGKAGRFELMVHPALPSMANPSDALGDRHSTVVPSQETEVGELRLLRDYLKARDFR
jgi:predicted glycoside hydrolase/deacetylase ChbG (UPF0249 family)